MDAIIFQIKNQIFTTSDLLIALFKSVNTITLLLSLGLLYVIFLRRWPFQRILSFFSSIFLLTIALVRFEAFLLATFGPEGSQIGVDVTRTFFFIVALGILFYNAAVKQ